MSSLTINGERFHADVDPKMPLLWYLRDALGLAGTKFGCGLGQCWACTVLVDGRARPSCTLTVEAAEGLEITTIEGIPANHPLKRAWVEEQVPQCGYCQSGQLLQALSLIAENPHPGDDEIAKAMQHNLCRCGTYLRINRAIRRVVDGGGVGDESGPSGRQETPGPEHQAGADEVRSYAMNPFVRIGTDGAVTVIAKHLEAGQGIYTGLATILAEELDADWRMVRVESAPADERLYNNLLFGEMQGTGGSTSIANSYEQYRRAGAGARAMLVAAAAAAWEVATEEIEVQRGVVLLRGGGRRAGFAELAEQASQIAAPEEVVLKDPRRFELIGKQSVRLDIPSKTDGTARYAIDVHLPGMLTAVVARPPRFGGRVKSFDAEAARGVAGVTDVVEIPEGVAVVARDYWSASRGREALSIEWDDTAAEMRGTAELLREYHALLETPGQSARSEGDIEAAMAGAVRSVDATYEFPYLAHAPLEALSCVVQLTEQGAEIWAGDQFQTGDQANAAQAAGLEVRQVRIHTLFAGGSFGRRANPPSDYVVETVHIAKAIGGRAPVRLLWSRQDDIRGGFYRPMFVHRVKGGLDGEGRIIAWQHRLAGQSIMPSEGVDEGAVEGVADMPYAIPNLSVEVHTTQVGVPVLWWRSVGHSHTAFGVEVFLDELARAAGRDPLELRRELLKGHPRHLAVMNLAAEKAGWGASLPAGRGRGLAVHRSFGTYVAEVAEVAVADDGSFTVERVVCAVDCGTPINPEIIRTQMEGGIAFGLSAALAEAVTLDSGRVEQSDFNSYPVLRFGKMPRIEVYIVPSTEKPTGVGEPGVPPIAPAVANALSAVTGRPCRRLPLLSG